MGKKGKTGKSRLDKYYHLAKEQGYRARSAFKLIQLTQRNDIFSGCRTLLDLCAAPGGWLQVAQKNMPVASQIVGVDLAPIKPIRGVLTIQADITTQRCRTLLKKEFQEKGCDVVLHDGAPNVGTSWIHDAYAQNELVLHATKLAAEFLRPGGTYITKVFRSQDYLSLLWVFQQLFNKVIATKPSSSRNVSAEIFVVCSGFKKPHKIDPKFFDIRHVFLNADSSQIASAAVAGGVSEGVKRNLAELVKTMGKKNRQGYSEGDDYRETTITSFFQTTTSPAEFLVKHHKLTFPEDDIDSQRIKTDPSTTEELLTCCNDLRVLGKREYSLLIKWRAKLLKSWSIASHHTMDEINEDTEEIDEELLDPKQIEEDKEIMWQKELESLQSTIHKKTLNEKRKLRDKLKKLKLQREMSLGAFDVVDEDPELFRLSEAMALLEEEDNVLLNSGILDKIQPLDTIPDDIENSDSDSSHSHNDDNEEEDNILDEDAKRLSRMAVDMEVWADMEKERRGEKEAKRVLRAKKETRRQQAYAEWNRELNAASKKLNQEAESLGVKDIETDEDEEEEEEEIIPESIDFKIKEPMSDIMSDDESDNDSINSVSHKNTALGHSKPNTKQSERWLNQDLFQAVGVTLDDLIKEDNKAEGKTDTFEINKYKPDEERLDNKIDGIRELSDSELPPMPLTDKQKRKEKRKRELEKTERTNQSKRIHTSLKGLGGLIDDKAGGSFIEVPQSIGNGPEIYDEDDNEETNDSNSRFTPKTPKEIAQIQAMGALLMKKRTRLDLIDGAYNRYAFDDEEGLPEWFIEDEEARTRPELPVTKEMMKEYRDKIKEISQRPIRKVLEASARKKLRLKKRLEKVRKQAETIAESAEHTEASKASSIRKLVRKATKEESKDKSYIAAKKGGGGAVVSKGGMKGGAYRVVDKRLKKDKRALKNAAKKKKKRR